MKTQAILFVVASYAVVGEAAVCWTNGLNLLLGGQPWGSNCQQQALPVAPIREFFVVYIGVI